MAAPQRQQQVPVSSLPRSVTWRLRLGLLKSPAQSVDGNRLTLKDVVRHNPERISEEQSQYERLQAAYGDHLTRSDSQEKEEEEEEAESEQLSNPSSQELDPLSAGASALDPLTAMLQEQQAQEDRRQQLDLRYRKERARRKRGLATEAKVVVADCDEEEVPKKLDADMLNIIDKDLHRLPSPDISDFEGVSIQWETDEQRQAWIEALREVLYIYGQEHQHIGYRQGMHELASYIWIALEIDRKVMRSKEAAASTEVQIQQQEHSALLFGRAAAYAILRSILGNVRQAFDVKVASNSRPLEDMSHSILAKIKQQHNYHGMQDQLTPLLLNLSVPPQLYCTKWIRLLFSREVVGAQNVIVLWDVFIELVSEGWEWMAVLETTAASRILLCRDQLLDTSLPDYGHHHAMDLLMNMPPMNNIELLVARLKALLELQKYTQCMHQEVAKQDEAKHNNPLYLNNNSRQQPNVAFNQQHHPSHGGFPTFGDDISSVFSLKSIRQSLEQGAQQLTSSGDTLKKRLVDEWNGLKHQPIPQQGFQQTLSASPPYIMDNPLFGDAEELQPQQQQQQQPKPVAAGYPQPVAALNPQHAHPRRVHQQQQQIEKQPHYQRQQHHPIRPQPAQASNFQAPMSNGMGQQPLMGLEPPKKVASIAANISNGTTNSYVPEPQAPGQLSHELAYRLGNSVAVLQDFVMSVARPHNQTQYTNLLSFQNGDVTPGKVPNSVWEALAEVEAVRNVLLRQQPGQNSFK